jgi:hypothetical protein
LLFALVVAALESRDEHCDARADAGLEVAALETRDELCEAGLLPYAALPQLEIGGVGITAHSASARASRTSFQGRAVKGRLSIDSPTGHTTAVDHGSTFIRGPSVWERKRFTDQREREHPCIAASPLQVNRVTIF